MKTARAPPGTEILWLLLKNFRPVHGDAKVVILMLISFMVSSCYPPKIGLFLDPTHEKH